MQTLSSASLTCIASESAVEWTATVAMPSSLQARRTRSAISPRFAIRILSNITLLDDHQRLIILDRLLVLDEEGGDGAGSGSDDVVERLHRLDDEDAIALVHLRADLEEGLGARCRSEIGGSHHRRLEHAGVQRQVGGGRR